MPIDALRQIVTRLNTSATALAALGAALDARIAGTSLPSALAPHVERLLAGLGADEALDGVAAAELVPLLAEIRTFALLHAKLASTAMHESRWEHTQPDLLRAAGDVSSGFPHNLATMIAPMLEGLADRLAAADAEFLDVGVGVAALSIAMARRWPALRVVGIDVWGPSLALGRENVAAAGLESRIELRQQSVADLADVDRYDLGWIPSLFLPGSVIPDAIDRVARALRPGGWLLFPTTKPSDDPILGPVGCIRTVCFGGAVIPIATVLDLLRRAGLVDVRMLPSPPTALNVMVTGRRPP
jgi:predicted O-methyltransferase YrrM